MHEKLKNLRNQAISQVIAAISIDELEAIRIEYLGKKGQINEFTKELKYLSPEDRSQVGQLVNEVKQTILEAIGSSPLNSQLSNLKSQVSDPSLPGIPPAIGHLHPVTFAIEEISSIFERIGFTRVRYPEVDWEWYPFESLNMPKSHPARDEWETFFVDAPPHPKLGRVVLTPHTSNGQVREMERVKTPPIRMINIAKCYRRQSDISHTVMFHQFEGLCIDKGISIANLKGTVDYFAHQFYGPHRRTRLRPFHFQFTEPSFEVDITCDICDGRGCNFCKEGWLELGGAGMVHPHTLKSGKIDPDVYTGFAFGLGVERVYMMKSGLKVPDLRLLYSNDIRFLRQF